MNSGFIESVSIMHEGKGRERPAGRTNRYFGKIFELDITVAALSFES